MSVTYSPTDPTTVTNSFELPEDSVDDVDAASVDPPFEGVIDNALIAIRQLRPAVLPQYLEDRIGANNGEVRLVGDGGSNWTGIVRFASGSPVINPLVDAELGFVGGPNKLECLGTPGYWLSAAMTASTPGSAVYTNQSNQPVIFGNQNTKFAEAQNVAYAIPLSTFFPGEPGMTAGGASRVDGTNFGLVYAGILGTNEGLPGIMSLHSSANVFTFRTRLPRGSFFGLEVDVRPNNTGVAPTSVDAAVSAPMSIRIYEITINADFFTSGISTYSSASLQTDVLTLVWTGTCGANGNNVGTVGGTGGGANWVNSNIRKMNFLSGASNTSSATCGATAAFNASEEKEYMIAIDWPTFAGGDYASTWPSGMKPSIHKLVALMQVTTLGRV